MANKQLGRSLENLLVAKNRRLLEELTKLRVSWEDLSNLHHKAEDHVETLQEELNRQRGLNEKLENDLISVNREDKGSSAPAQGLAGLDIGGKPSVSAAYSAHSVRVLIGFEGGPGFSCVDRR